MGCMHLGKKTLFHCAEFVFKDAVFTQATNKLS